MTNLQRRLTVLGALAGGLLAAALAPAAVASADEYDLTPYLAIPLVPTQVEGYPPFIDIVTGTDGWVFNDLTTTKPPSGLIIDGTDTHTTFGSFTNDDFLQTGDNGVTLSSVHDPSLFITFEAGDQFDLANFGGGFENEWVDIASGPNAGVSDLLITPFGDFQTMGTFFSDLSAILSS